MCRESIVLERVGNSHLCKSICIHLRQVQFILGALGGVRKTNGDGKQWGKKAVLSVLSCLMDCDFFVFVKSQLESWIIRDCITVAMKSRKMSLMIAVNVQSFVMLRYFLGWGIQCCVCKLTGYYYEKVPVPDNLLREQVSQIYRGVVVSHAV